MSSLPELRERLRPEQQLAAEMIIYNQFADKSERKTLAEIAEELDVTDRTLYTWRQQPEFIQYSAIISDRQLNTFRAEADAQLIKLVKGTSQNGIPSVKGLELFYRLIDRMTNTTEITLHEGERRPQISDEELEERLKSINDRLE